MWALDFISVHSLPWSVFENIKYNRICRNFWKAPPFPSLPLVNKGWGRLRVNIYSSSHFFLFYPQFLPVCFIASVSLWVFYYCCLFVAFALTTLFLACYFSEHTYTHTNTHIQTHSMSPALAFSWSLISKEKEKKTNCGRTCLQWKSLEPSRKTERQANN